MRKLVLIFPIILLSLSSCVNKRKVENYQLCESETSPCLNGKALVEINTNKGKIIIELDGNSAPVTAGNFLDLVTRKTYENTVFHRVIREPFPFIVQGGDPSSNNPLTPINKYGLGSYIDESTGKSRTIPLEIKLKNEDSPRYNQLITNPTQLLLLEMPHKKGSLAMARSEELDSASAQFYICLKNLPELNGRYSVFGEVIKGLKILNKIEPGDLILDSKIISNQ